MGTAGELRWQRVGILCSSVGHAKENMFSLGDRIAPRDYTLTFGGDPH